MRSSFGKEPKGSRPVKVFFLCPERGGCLVKGQDSTTRNEREIGPESDLRAKDKRGKREEELHQGRSAMIKGPREERRST